MVWRRPSTSPRVRMIWAAYVSVVLATWCLSSPVLAQEAVRVIELSSHVSPLELAEAKAAFESGAVLKMYDADPVHFGGLFNLGVPAVQPDPAQTPMPHCILAAYRTPEGVLHTFLGVRAPPEMLDPEDCERHFGAWLDRDPLPGSSDLPNPNQVAWTPLLVTTLHGLGAGGGSQFSERLSVYRANGIDKSADYYMAVKNASTTPHYYGCSVIPVRCGWYNLTRDLTLTTNPNYVLFDHGPGNVSGSTTAGFTIGAGLSGIIPSASASYSVSWEQPDVTTTDYTSLSQNLANWHEAFTTWNGSWNGRQTPPTTSVGLYQSSQGAIFRVPQGVTAFDLLIRDTAWFRLWAEFPSEQFASNHDEGSALTVTIGVHAPVLLAYPGLLSGLPGDQGLLNVQAYIPSSTQGLSWRIRSKPDWLALSTTQGSTSAAITYHVSPNAPQGATGYIQLDTNPSYAAPSVKSGPLSIPFTVTPHRAPAGVLLAGGTAWRGIGPLDTAEIWEPTTGASVPTRGPMTQARQWHTATALSNGQILLTGGLNASLNSTATAELFDPATGLFTAGPTMASAHAYHTATLLHTGQVLIAGGIDQNGKATGVAEVYDPASHRFTRVGAMAVARQQHTATLLGDGRVLIAGGTGDYGDTNGFGEAEIYDPASTTFTRTGPLNTGRYAHTATLLRNGQVLVSGGANPQEDPLRSAELYTPTTGSFSDTGSLAPGRKYAASVLLPDHDVLLVGGYNYTNAASLYNPTSGHWRFAPNFMVEVREFPTAVGLSGTHTPYDGSVFVAGGVIVNSGSSRGTRIEVYDPTRGTWREAGRMSTARTGLTTTLFGPGVGTTSATVSPAQP